MLLLLSAITPVTLFLYLIYHQDTLKEPLKLLLKCFVGGIISTIPIMIIEFGLMSINPFSAPFAYSFYNAFIVAAGSEELLKFVFLYLIVWKSAEFDQHYDGIIYAVCVSMGFALVENILYVFENGFGTAVMRTLFSVPLHGLCGVVMGYFFALAKFSDKSKKRNYLLLSLFVPVFMHGFFDFLLMYMSNATLSGVGILLTIVFLTAFIIFIWQLGLKKIEKHVRRDKESLVSNEIR